MVEDTPYHLGVKMPLVIRHPTYDEFFCFGTMMSWLLERYSAGPVTSIGVGSVSTKFWNLLCSTFAVPHGSHVVC